MATAAGEGSAAKATNASSYGAGGVGGKFRKRPFRRSQTTPYDRPATASRNPSWLSKLVVDPASKLIAAGAQRFFSSVFRKRLPPPPPPPPQPPEERQDSGNGLQETVPDNQAGGQEPAGNEGGNPSCNYDSSGVSELEKLLKQKDFTRSEIDRLTQLLHSRAVDLPVKDDGKRIEANLSIQNTLSKPMLDSARHEQCSIPLEGSEMNRARAYGAISTPPVGKTLLENEIASPAELAKAYMGSKSSTVSPSKLGLRSQFAREEAVFINTSPFTSKSSMSSLAVKAIGHVGIPDNGFTPPRSRGRSAIYNMARTPYSRVRSTTIQKVSGSTSYGYTGPSSSASQSAWDNDGQFGSRPATLKRRSSVLDDDIGSVGPVRRIRQKANLLTHGLSHSARRMGHSSDVTQLQKLPLMDEAKNNISNTPSTSYAHVPPKSGEVAARILEHLEKMTPKEKSSESKLAGARDRSPVKLTPNMLRGQALRSLEDWDASKMLQNARSGSMLGDQFINSLPESNDSAAQEQGKGEENGPSKFISTSLVNADVTVPMKDIKAITGSANAAMPKFVAQPSERKRAFKMSAHEDSLELDDDIHSNGPASKFFDGGRGKMEKSMIYSNSIPSKELALDKTPVLPEVRSQPPPVLSKGAELEKHTGFTFSASHVSSTSLEIASISQSASALDKPTAMDDIPPFLSFGSKNVGNFSSSMDSKADSSSSLVSVSAGATEAPVKGLVSDKSDAKSYHQDGIVNGNSGTVPSLSSSTISTISVFSTGSPSITLVSTNGGPASSVSTLSGSSTLSSTKLADQNFTNSSNHLVSCSTVTAISTSGSTTSKSSASSSGLFVANVAPSISSAPVFKFGSSADPSTAVSATSTIANAGITDLKDKAEKENRFGNSSKLSFGSTSFPSANPGSSTFGLGSFVSSSAATGQMQGSLTGSGSAVSTQPSPPGSGIATVSQSMPVQFGSPSSPAVFGSSAITSFTSSSIFGSSAPTTSLSVSGSSAESSSASTAESHAAPSIFKFGVGFSASSSESNVITSGSGAAPATFAFGVSSAPSSLESNAVVTSGSGATPATFTFGVSNAPSSSESSAVTSSSGATAATFAFCGNSAPSSSSSSSVAPAVFNFGASSSASSSATSSSSTTPSMFSFGARSSNASAANGFPSSSGTAPSIFSFGASASASSSGANSVSSSATNSSLFGSSWQSPKSPNFGSTFNTSSPSTGFSFGASSSSFGPTNSAPTVFGSAIGASSTPIFPSLPSSSTQTMFGNPAAPFAASAGNNDQMNTEDSMAEDPVQSSTPVAPVFGQSPVSPSPQGFMLGTTVQPPAVPLQFGGQQNQAAPQNASQFQASSSLDFNAGGGSFSLGSSGPEKSGRKFIKVNRNRNRKR